mmetsp:Transcript_454/g.1152  ORF Transcript_454/g.1152 Transcript_454/m.1152 type:complete len:382 (-) Transcript_454:162-1307(-)
MPRAQRPRRFVPPSISGPSAGPLSAAAHGRALLSRVRPAAATRAMCRVRLRAAHTPTAPGAPGSPGAPWRARRPRAPSVCSHPQDLQLLVKADRDPIWLRLRPLQLVHLRLRVVCQDGIIDWLGHVRQVPDECLVVVARGADMARGVRRPRKRVDTLRVALELRGRQRRHPDVEHHDLVGVHGDRRQVVGILFVPRQPQQRHRRPPLPVRTFVDDRRVLEAAQIEHADGAIGADRREDVDARREREVIHLFVVRDQLRFGLHLGDVPDGAGRVDRAGADDVRILLVPVERRQRRAELGVLVVVQQALQSHALVVIHIPQPQVVARRREQVAPGSILIGDPHDLGRRVRVLEPAIIDELVRLLIQLDDAHRVGVLLLKRADR